MKEVLKGLVLMGGNSSRMGVDKSTIRFHEHPQSHHLIELMEGMGITTHVSVKKGQEVVCSEKKIEDAFGAKGPMNGLLSAHNAFPSNAWLVMAVDMPLVKASTIRKLIESRDAGCVATAYVNPQNNLPEPLAAIWEVNGLIGLKNAMISGQPVYPSQFLRNNKVKLIFPVAPNELLNVNTLEELKQARELLAKDNFTH